MQQQRCGSLSLLDSSALSSQSWEDLAAAECSSARRLQARPLPPLAPGVPDAKRRRVEGCAAPLGQAAGELCGLATLGSAGDEALTLTLATASLDDCTAGSLCCAETGDALDEDCSSAGEAAEEGFTVYRSPLGLAAAAEAAGPRAPRAPPPRAVLADCGAAAPPPLHPQHPLAADPDLAEMLSVLWEVEAQTRPDPDYLAAHGERALGPDAYLDASMRRTAASWLVEVSAEFGLHQETLSLATALLDRFLSAVKAVPRTQLQLVAVACTLVAAKHEEETHPSVIDFTSIADNCFEPRDLLRMEGVVLRALGWRVNTPTTHTFLSVYKQALALQPRTCALACYLAELAALEYPLLRHRPSLLAAAAARLAGLYTADPGAAGAGLPAVTCYSTHDLLPAMRQLLALQRSAHAAADYASPLLAVRDKYRGHQWFCVAATTPFDRLPASFLAAVDAGPAAAPGAAAGAPRNKPAPL